MKAHVSSVQSQPVKPGAHWQRLATHSPCGALQPLGHAPSEQEAPVEGVGGVRCTRTQQKTWASVAAEGRGVGVGGEEGDRGHR